MIERKTLGQLVRMLPHADVNKWAVGQFSRHEWYCSQEDTDKDGRPHLLQGFRARSPEGAVRRALRELGVVLPEDVGLNYNNLNISDPAKLCSVGGINRPRRDGPMDPETMWVVWAYNQATGLAETACGYVMGYGDSTWCVFPPDATAESTSDVFQPNMESAVLCCFLRYMRPEFDPRAVVDRDAV